MTDTKSTGSAHPVEWSSTGFSCVSTGAKMSAATAKRVEKSLDVAPNELESHLMLLGFYGKRSAQQEKYFEHMLWMIDSRPGDLVCSLLGDEHHSRGFKWTESRAKEVSKRWNRQVKKFPNDALVLCNAAGFFSDRDWPKGKRLYMRAKDAAPRLARPARELAYQYRLLASQASDGERLKLVVLALQEAEESANRRKENEGELIGVLQEFAPLAIKFGHYRLARRFARRLQVYSSTYFLIWEQYATLYLAWLDLRENKWSAINAKLVSLRALLEAQPSNVAVSNAAVSFVNDALQAGEKPLAIYILEMLILGCPGEFDKGRIELEEWLHALKEGRKPKLKYLAKELTALY